MSKAYCMFFFCFYCYCDHRYLHVLPQPCPTRRSAELGPPSVSPHPSHADRPCTTLRPCGQRKISVARKLPIIAPATAPARAITMSLRLSASGHLRPAQSPSRPALFPAPDRPSPPASPPYSARIAIAARSSSPCLTGSPEAATPSRHRRSQSRSTLATG